MSPASGAGTGAGTNEQPTVAGLGEAGILGLLQRRYESVPAAGHWPQGTLGPGDDAAVVPAPDGRVVLTVDAMAQDRDFRQRWPSGAVDTGYSTGWKAAAQNLSDLNAMGARASSLLVALTLPSSTPAAWLDAFAAGLAGAIRHLGATACRVAGGDLGSASSITVAVTATGDLGGRAAMTRRLREACPSGADLVLAGRAGWSAAGLAVLETERSELLGRLRRAEEAERSGRRAHTTVPVRRTAALAAAAQLRPRPLLEAGPRAAAAGALAMMDVSDGLLRDAGRLAAANGMRFELDPAWIATRARPLAALADTLDADPAPWVSAGGEDYGLLAVLPTGTAPPSGFERVGRLLPGVPAEGGAVTAAPDGVPAEDGAGTGWDHFGG